MGEFDSPVPIPKKRLTAVVTLASTSAGDLPPMVVNRFGLPFSSLGAVDSSKPDVSLPSLVVSVDELSAGAPVASLFEDAGSVEETSVSSGAESPSLELSLVLVLEALVGWALEVDDVLDECVGPAALVVSVVAGVAG